MKKTLLLGLLLGFCFADWIIPVKDANTLTGWFYEKRGDRYHYALDIPAKENTLVYATVAGFVIEKGFDYAKLNKDGYGNYIKIKDQDGNIHIYAHLADYDVKQNEEISAGQVIGSVGHTGLNGRNHPHLHYGVLDKFGVPVFTTKKFGIVWKLNN